ncbi:MAG: DUF1573 domain-containing protein [Caldilineaceae bacterium]|nr:DUF1573 domain-containing protein [Caldilineaceae bacterium]MCB0136151.1 DUF1573 domain-containing protein [Caldilineaceae bacterium]
MLLVLIGLLVVACGGSPAIVASPEEFDFGDVPAADPVTATFVLQNQGNGTLRIDSVRTSCGCTTADVADTSIAPHDDTILTVTFDPQAHEGLYGPLLRMIYIASNDPDQPEIEIPVTVNVLAPEEASQ